MATLLNENDILNKNDLPEVDLPETGSPQPKLQITVTKPADIGQIAQGSDTPVETPLNDTSTGIQDALNSGYSIDEITQYLQNKGQTEDDARLTVVETVKNKVKQAKDAGYSDEEINQFLTSSNYDPNLINSALNASNVNDKYTNLDYKASNDSLSEEDKAMELSDLYKNIHYEYATLGKQVVGFLSDDMAISARRDVNRLNNAIAGKLRKEGLNAYIDNDTGAVMITNNQGVSSEVDSSFLASLYNSKGEFGGAVAGGIAGARAGAAVGAAGFSIPFVGPVSTTAGAIVGGLGGSAIGAMAGRAADLAMNSAKLSEDLSTSLYLTQLKQAGIADIVFSTVGAGLLKAGSIGLRGLVKSYKYVTHGNPKGAYKALKDNLNISDAQAKDLVDKFEKLNKRSAPGEMFEEKAVHVITSTQKEAETAVKSAAQISERVSTVVKQSIDERAKSLHRALQNVTDENTGYLVKQDLKAYQDDVKSFFDVVKKQGADAVDGTDFRFDLDKLTIKPVLKNIEDKLSDPRVREQFVNYANRINIASQDRTFSGLLELRTAVNEFKYSKILGVRDTEALNTVLNKIDSTIDKAAKMYIPNGSKWLANFKTAKSEYAKMKVFQENAIVRLLERSSITEEGIQRAISRYSNAKEVDSEVFNAVLLKLSPKTKVKVEGAAIKNLVDKYTLGKSTELQAVDFPQLAEELGKLNMSTIEGKNLKTAIEEIAKVYRNDSVLSGLSGKTQSQVSNSLATNFAAKAQVGFINYVWQSIYKYAPTKIARNTALIHLVEKTLRNPLHAKTVEDLLKAMPVQSQQQTKTLIQQLQIQQAKQGPTQLPQTIKMYKQSTSGKLVVTDGKLGKGIYLVDKIKNPKPEMNIIKHEVDTSKILDITGDANAKLLRSDTTLRKSLIDQGYNGVRVDDKVMLFPETQVGYSAPKSAININRDK